MEYEEGHEISLVTFEFIYLSDHGALHLPDSLHPSLSSPLISLNCLLTSLLPVLPAHPISLSICLPHLSLSLHLHVFLFSPQSPLSHHFATRSIFSPVSVFSSHLSHFNLLSVKSLRVRLFCRSCVGPPSLTILFFFFPFPPPLSLCLSYAAGIVRKKQWCEMVPCLEDEGCDLLVNKSGWTCTQPGGRVKTTTVSSRTLSRPRRAYTIHFAVQRVVCKKKKNKMLVIHRGLSGGDSESWKMKHSHG